MSDVALAEPPRSFKRCSRDRGTTSRELQGVSLSRVRLPSTHRSHRAEQHWKEHSDPGASAHAACHRVPAEPAPVPLNGPYGLAMGEALDVLNSSAELQTITFELSGPRGQELAVLGVPNDRAVALDVVQFGQPASLLPPSRRTCGHLPQRRAPRPARPAGNSAGQRFAHRCRSSGPVHGARTCAVRTYEIIRESLLHPWTRARLDWRSRWRPRLRSGYRAL